VETVWNRRRGDPGYDVEEWLPVVYDIAGSLLQSARPDSEPPTLVHIAQESIGWLSRAIAELDESSEEAPTSPAEALARLLAVWTFTDVALRHRPSASLHQLIRAVCDVPYHWDKPVNRNDQHIVLVVLHSDRAHYAQGTKRRGVAPPPPPPPSEPPGLLGHPPEVALVVRPGLGIDRESNAVRRDRHRIDVPAAPPAHAMTHPPPVFLEQRQGAPHLILRASADRAPPGEGQPVRSAQTDDDCEARTRQPGRAKSMAISSIPNSPAVSPANPNRPARDNRRYCWRRA
jgi:hypothetical protein